MDIREFFVGFKKGMENFGENLSVLVNSVLLFIVYIVGVGLTSIFAKISEKHFLETKIQKYKNSYWSELNLKKESKDSYYRQF